MAGDSQVWKNIVAVIDSSLSTLAALDPAEMATLDSDSVKMLNQLRCHVMLNGNRLGLRAPFRPDLRVAATEADEAVYVPDRGARAEFETQLQSALKSLGIADASTVDFYPIIASVSKSSSEPSDRVFIYSVDPEDELTGGSTSAYVRLRRDHLERLGLKPKQRIEATLDNFEKWRKQ